MKNLKELPSVHVTPKGAHERNSAPGQTARLDFRKATLQTVLDYFKDNAGFMIEMKANVPVDEKVDVWRSESLDDDQALVLLEDILHKQGCTLIQYGRRLSIMRTEDAKRSYIPIRRARNRQAMFKEPVSSRGLFTLAASASSN